jgi:hypothetical protein
MLANRHRRRLLVHLIDGNPEDRAEIPQDIVHEGEVREETLDALGVEFEQTHLPMLERAGVIDWDHDEEVIVKGPEFDTVRPMLELLVEHQDELPEDWP